MFAHKLVPRPLRHWALARMAKTLSFHKILNLSEAKIRSTKMTNVSRQGRKSVISEFYDEIVFQDPTQNMYTLLTISRWVNLATEYLVTRRSA
jgi:hypothetical protein